MCMFAEWNLYNSWYIYYSEEGEASSSGSILISTFTYVDVVIVPQDRAACVCQNIAIFEADWLLNTTTQEGKKKRERH